MKSLLKRTDFWICINEQASKTNLLCRTFSTLIKNVINWSRARDLDLMIESKLIETMVSVVEKDVPSETKILLEKDFNHIVSSIGVNCLYKEKCLTYFRTRGVMEHLEILDETCQKFLRNEVQ